MGSRKPYDRSTFERFAEHELKVFKPFQLGLFDLAEVVVTNVLPEVLKSMVVQVSGKERSLKVRVISDLQLLP